MDTSKNGVCLLATLHDPAGKLTEPASRVFRKIAALYQDILIDVTLETDYKVRTHIGHFILSQPDGIANARKRLLAKGLDETNCSHFHLVDFDRLLFWYLNYPHELEASIEIVAKHNSLVVFGRLPDAFNSHPEFQRLTEEACNQLFAIWYGRRIDVLSASRGIPRAIGERILERTRGNNPAYLDAEWPMIVGQRYIHYIEVMGLGYESSLFGIQKTDSEEILLRLDNLNSVADLICG